MSEKNANEQEHQEPRVESKDGGRVSKGKRVGTWIIFVVVFLIVLIGAAMVTLSRSYQGRKHDDQNAGVKSALEVAKAGGEQEDASSKVGDGRVGYSSSSPKGQQVPAIPVVSTKYGSESEPSTSMDAPMTFDGGSRGSGNSQRDIYGDGAAPTAQSAGATPKKSYDVDLSKLSGVQALMGNNNKSADGILNLEGVNTPGVKARLIGDRNWILAKGEMIDCVLNTALRSTVPGMSSCTVTKNIYSDNGKIVLIERGTVVTGEYRATISPGQSRISVLWNRLRTPKGVIVDLDSPGSDSLGRGGLDGEINNHWGQRLGAAFLLSSIQDAIGYAAAVNAPAGNGANYYQNIQNTGSEMANTILKQTIGIPPTLDRDQGTRLSIFVARDLDFSKVYGLNSVE